MAYEAVLSEPLVLGFGAIAVLYIITRCRGVIIGWVVSAQRIGDASASAHDTDLVDDPLQLVVSCALPCDMGRVLFGRRVDPVASAEWYDLVALLHMICFAVPMQSKK